jgi:hypothetical protein
MSTYLTYRGAAYKTRSVSTHVPAPASGPEAEPEASSGELLSILFDALLPFPEATQAVVASLKQRLGREASP